MSQTLVEFRGTFSTLILDDPKPAMFLCQLYNRVCNLPEFNTSTAQNIANLVNRNQNLNDRMNMINLAMTSMINAMFYTASTLVLLGIRVDCRNPRIKVWSRKPDNTETEFAKVLEVRIVQIHEEFFKPFIGHCSRPERIQNEAIRTMVIRNYASVVLQHFHSNGLLTFSPSDEEKSHFHEITDRIYTEVNSLAHKQ